MKHTDQYGQINTLRYAHEISLLKSHKERVEYMSDIDEKWFDLVYLLSMQMAIPKTIADLPTREERKKAWEELPEHNRTMKGMKDMVYHRIVRIFKDKNGKRREPLQKGWNFT
jgi:hypothetical protein